ncbi:MAG: 4-hydroxy-tetrahydrodipicolinate reductase [Bacteroidota bacterium]
MKIALIGYGKMGQAIEEVALQRGHTIVARVNSNNPLAANDLSLADVAIEFTRPELAPVHIRHCADIKLPVVVGTTAWHEDLQGISDYVNTNEATLLHATNFSIGVNILFAVNKKLAQLMSDHAEYEASIEEVHHIQKLDAPSGTAITLAEGIIGQHEKYNAWNLHEDGKSAAENVVDISAVRLPDVPGTHHVRYQSTIDTITLSHEAHTRKGFALGSVVAAEWIYGKKGVFTMNDVLSL